MLIRLTDKPLHIDSSPERNGEIKLAHVAPEKVLIGSSPAYGLKARSSFVFDPATGALIVDPDLDLKIRKAIMGEVRRIKYRLYFKFTRLYLEKFWLDRTSANLKIVGNLTSYSRDCRAR